MKPQSLEDQSTSKDRLRLWLRLLKTTRAIEAELRNNLRKEFAGTLPRFDVLAALYRFEDGLKMSAVSGILRVSTGNVTGIVDRLSDEGLVERLAVPDDRRAFLVKLTEKGRVEFTKQAKAHEAWVNEMLGGLPADETKDLTERLKGIANPLIGGGAS